ncbi:hypothetical protein [Flavimarina sp. Hel_I_48]|uniref:hypothetical protein n=1 Tax=Flavimarina sp. Hel_I_48 TaxID=1392488 RepID=UPI0004DF7D8E|nr:hypothetical protein [Flavimarina sp. Hel_I_48]
MKKKVLFLSIFLLMCGSAFSQFKVGFHQSNLPFIALGYEIQDRFTPELRLGSDQFIEDLSIEAVLTYKFINKEDYNFYGGLGYKTTIYEGLVIPIGFNFYPFENKKFGFHIEAAPILLNADILRGSFGIHYRFLKS